MTELREDGALVDADGSTEPARGVWRSMQSAPRDGTVVDLWANGTRYPDCFWEVIDDEEELAGWQQQYAEARGCSYRIDITPTHWMIHLEPPK